MGTSNYYCPNTEATSFKPYYLSAVDLIAWRFGIPEMLYPAALIPGMREMGKAPYLVSPGHTWGHIYPRSGAVAQDDDRKAAAVMVQRAADFITRKSQPHIYLPLTGSTGGGYWSPGPVIENNKNHKWQMLYPVASKKCTRFGSTPGWPTNDLTGRGGNYTWTLWRRYGCCTEIKGIFIGAVDVPEALEICLTPPSS